MILQRIVTAKQEEIAHLKKTMSRRDLERALRDLPPTRNFKKAVGGSGCAIIAEVKRSSPSRGRIVEKFDPIAIASLYAENGAAAVSVLTERRFFEGDARHLSDIAKAVAIPLLRKDFILDPHQIYETRIMGADAVLLISGLLGKECLRDFIALCGDLGLSALVEIHTRDDLDKALEAGADIIGINNRDLKTFSTDLRVSLDLAGIIPGDRLVVSESGIHTRTDIDILMGAGIHAFLIGEALVSAENTAEKLKELLSND
ncbi:MAG: indole-3-glycerol phosphate synthase TrpC [Syntrophales bacterium]